MPVGYTTKREALNEFMMEWDGLKSHNGRVIVMAATNRPYDLDEAVIRRMPRRVMSMWNNPRGRGEYIRVVWEKCEESHEYVGLQGEGRIYIEK